MKNLETGHFNAPTSPITKNNDEIKEALREVNLPTLLMSMASLTEDNSWLEEKYPGKRKLLSMIAGFSIWVCGLGSVLSFSSLADLKPLGFLNIDLNMFGLIDFAVANLLLPINALLIAAFSGWII